MKSKYNIASQTMILKSSYDYLVFHENYYYSEPYINGISDLL